MCLTVHSARVAGSNLALECPIEGCQSCTRRKHPGALTKTTRPTLASVLARDKLFTVLDGREHASVLWVWGPPGSGKTTLVASYLESRDLDSHWYQLDTGDSDVATFFYFMGLAVTRARRANR